MGVQNIRCFTDSLIDTNYFNLPCTIVANVSLNEYSLSQLIQLFPNPAQETISVTSSDLELGLMKLYAADGRTIPFRTTFSNQINVSALSPGLYFFQIETDKGTATKKWIKE